MVSAAGEGTDSDDPSAMLMRRLIDSFAEYERLIISARTRAALDAKRRRGERVSGLVPFGYTLAQDGRTLEANAEEAQVIETIRTLREQGHSMPAIADELIDVASASAPVLHGGSSMCAVSSNGSRGPRRSWIKPLGWIQTRWTEGTRRCNGGGHRGESAAVTAERAVCRIVCRRRSTPLANRDLWESRTKARGEVEAPAGPDSRRAPPQSR